jgi:hypothetical protein
MLKKCSPFIFVLLALCATTPDALSQDKPERVKGVVVAYQRDLFSSACPCGICGGSVLLRIEGARRQRPAYARVDFAYSQNMSPYEVFVAKKEWELTVVRAEEHDGPLKEFYPVLEEGTGKPLHDSQIPMWKVVEGGSELPYGKVIPTYLLAKNISEGITKRRRVPPFSRP